MALVKFYRGVASKFNVEKHIDGIYFCLDTHEIIVNGDAYGYYAPNNKGIKAVEYTAPSTLTLTYLDDTTSEITLQEASAGASVEESKAGLMSAANVYKLANIAEGAQVNVIETVKVNGTVLSITDKAVNVDLTTIQSDIKKNKPTAVDKSINVADGTEANGSQIKVNLKTNGGINLGTDGLEIDSSALVQYKGENAVEVTDLDTATNTKTIKLNIKAKTGNVISNTSDGLFATVQLKALDIPATETSVAKKFGLVGIADDGTETQLGTTVIDIYKDKSLESVELGKIPTGQTGAGDDALIFVYNLADGTQKTVYIDVADFLREAEAGNGIVINDGKYSVQIDTAANEKGSDANAYLQLTSAGLKIVGVNAAITAAKTAATEALAAEAAARQSADNTLQNNIDSEATRAKAAESANTTAITTETTDRKAADSTLQANIDTEVARAKKAEEANAANISTNAAAIATETTDRQSADKTLQSNIDAEATSRTNGDTATLTSAKEYTDEVAKTADSALTAEVTRAKAAEAQTLADAKDYSDNASADNWADED